MIRCYNDKDRLEVEAIISSGLLELEALAALLSPPEDEGYFDKEFIEFSASLDEDSESWWVSVSEEGRYKAVHGLEL